MENSPIKIIVTYHKKYPTSPDILRHPELYVPILAGKESKKNNVEPFMKNMLTDNVGDNMSWINPYLNELTAMYWVWKHPKEIGSPQYIGAHHYRRFFNLEDVYKVYEGKAVINIEREGIPQIDGLKYFFGLGMEENAVNIAKEVFGEKEQMVKKWFTEYMNLMYQYDREMFVVKWDIFEMMMAYMTDLANHMAVHVYYTYPLDWMYRNMSFLTERMMGFFYYCLEQSKIVELHKAECHYFYPYGYRG